MHGFDFKQSGEMLLTNGDCNWVKIKSYDKFPENAVCAGLDWRKDKVWIGKAVTGEPGKITCDDNGSENPVMWNLWTHKDGRAEEGYVLTIS